ncbi:MAG: hypothetical protein BroJett012_07950 [Betaproteobacteria bacterium]|nr:MAG: hypothetical protein BroJett012_07950 [Betaproteobacteria bacterium]
MMEILNRHHLKGMPWPKGALYVGRGTPLGNPFVIGQDGDREECIARYRPWLEEKICHGNPAILTALVGAKRANALVCSCTPAPCHAAVIAELSEDITLHGLPPSRCYAGIGSRETPKAILATMRKIAIRLGEMGYTLRSGGADGADTAFEEAAKSKEIFLPWPDFNGRKSVFGVPSDGALEVASTLHPGWAKLGNSVKALHGRNSHQVLGEDLDSPSDFVVCWTRDGAETEAQRSEKTGGTGQAIALADRWGIPVFNLANKDALDRLGRFLKGE